MQHMTVSRCGVVAVVLALFATACGPDDGTPDDDGAASDRSTLVAGLPAESEVTDLIPHGVSHPGKAVVLHTILTPLLETDDNNEIFSNLLESWDVSDDARTVTLNLREDIEWSDGEPVTSRDVVMSLTQYLDPSISQWSERIGGVAGQLAFAEGDVDRISGLTAPDDHTVLVELTHPDAAWLPTLAAVGKEIPVLPAHVLGDVPHDDLHDHQYFKTFPVSNGPYSFVELARGEHIELERNDGWSLGQADFAQVFYKYVASDVMRAQLETGEIQFMLSVDPGDVDRLSSSEGIEIQTTTGVAPRVFEIMHAEPLDPRVRQAMVYAIDRKGICAAVLSGYCTVPVTNTRLVGLEWAIPDDLIEYHYDPDRARKLLDEAGWDSSTELVLLAATATTDEMELVLGNMAEVGINWRIENMDASVALERFENEPESFNGWFNGGADFTFDPSAVQPYVSCDQHYPAGANIIRYCNEEVDDLFSAGRQVLDEGKRAEIYQSAFRILNEEVAEIYLHVPDTIIAYNSDLKGAQVHGNLSSQFWNIGEWYWESTD